MTVEVRPSGDNVHTASSIGLRPRKVVRCRARDPGLVTTAVMSGNASERASYSWPSGRIVSLAPVRKETNNVVASRNVTTNDSATEDVDETGIHTPINELPEPDVRAYSMTLAVELAFQRLMFRMDVLRFVFPEIHPDHDAEEDPAGREDELPTPRGWPLRPSTPLGTP